MATPFRIKRSAVPGRRPTVSDLQLGELALNTYDAELLTLRSRPGIGTDVVRLGAGTTVTNIIFVTQDGKDSNTGLKIGDAKRTIGAALTEATAGTVIKVSAGSYLENNPLPVPPQVSIVGNSLREVSVSPLNPDKDLFYVANGDYIAEMSFTGSMDYGSAIVAFNPDKVGYFDQSPYVQNCTNFIPNSIGMKIDGANAIGPIKSMVVDSYTQYNQGGIGVSITNEGYAQLVSLFTICDDVAVYCGSGSACDVTNSNSSFGNFGLIADGVGSLKQEATIATTASSNAFEFEIDLTTPTYNIASARYDNVTGILTATTDSPHNFSLGMSVNLSGLAFTCPSGPEVLTYPTGNYGYVFETVSVAPGRYYDAHNLIQANRMEIQDKSLAAVALAYTDFYFPGDEETNSRSRYYDSYRLIQKNKQEIVDKSLASIAVGFPSGFYFPDEDETTPQSRYYDASGLIQRNKQEIIDKSLGAVAIAHSDFYFPGDEQTNSRSRYYDAYRLIQNNKDVIVSVAWTNTQSVYTGISTTEDKCKRDLGYFVDAVATDVLTGGNNYAREFTLQYFNNGLPIVNGLLQEEEESIYAFHEARQLMKAAITNTLVGAAYSDLTITDSGDDGDINNYTIGDCFDVQSNIDNLVGIITTTIGAGNTSGLPNPNYGYFNLSVGIGTTSSPGGFKCARDLGFLVEAIATDVFTGGNKYSRDFTIQYFDNSGNPIGAGLIGEEAESITAFNAARDLAKKAITNQLNVKNLGISSGPATYGGPGIAITVYQSGNPDSCADVQSNIDNLVGIVTTVIGAGTTTFLSTFGENLGISTTNKCARDLGYLVDAISTDVFTGGNKYSRDFTRFYFDSSGVPINNGLSGEESQSVYSFNTLREYSKKAITNQLNYKEIGISSGPAIYGGPGIAITVYPSGNPDACTDVQDNIDNLVGIVTNVIGGNDGLDFLSTFSQNTGAFPSGSNKCYRDIGYLVDAVSLDVRDYTNKNIRQFIAEYFDANGYPLNNGLTGEVEESVVAFNAVRDYAKKALNNQLNSRDLTVVADPVTGFNTDPNSCANVLTFIDNLVGTVNSSSVGIGTTFLNLPSVSAASTTFSAYVGTSTLPHTYNGSGEVKVQVSRPYDGQCFYFDRLYYSITGVEIISGGDNYTGNVEIFIDPPQVEWGISATAVAEVKNGKVVGIEMISNGRGYTFEPKITFSTVPNVGINTAIGRPILTPTYYIVQSSTPISGGISTVTTTDNVPYQVPSGTFCPIFKQSRVLASGHSFEYIGSGTEIFASLPRNGGVVIPGNETVTKNGGLVVYTSTDQSGNFKIGDGVIINQQDGSISGSFYSKSLFSTMTPFILALGGE